MRSRIRRRRSAKRSRTPSQADVRGPLWLGRFRAEAEKGNAGQHQSRRRRRRRGSPCSWRRARFPTTGPARCSVAASVPVSRPLAYSSASDRHEIGNDRLQRGVVDRPPAGVDQHDKDQDGQRHPVVEDEERADRDGEGAQHIRDGHERAAFEPVGEGAGRQGEQEPRKAVRGDDARRRPAGGGSRPRPSSGTAPAAKPSPELARVKPIQRRGNGRPSGFLPDAVLCPATDAHKGLCAGPTSCNFSGPRIGARIVPSGSWRDERRAPPQRKQIAKGGGPPCRESH